MQEKADDPAFVAQCQSRVKALVCEAALLPVRVDRDLERIQVRSWNFGQAMIAVGCINWLVAAAMGVRSIQSVLQILAVHLMASNVVNDKL